MSNRSRRLGLLLTAPVAVLATVALTACGSSSTPPGASDSPSSGSVSSGVTPSGPTGADSSAPAGPVAGADTEVGIRVDPKFGTKPTLSIPGGPAPKALTAQVLTVGTGGPVKKDDLLVANYVGQTWAPKQGKPNVFDSSFSRGAPTGFVIGAGQVIPGWDKTLVGKTLGSRVLLTIPPTDGYGASGQPSANISGTDTLVFVVDLVAAYPPGAAAPGTAVSNIPAGWPKISNVPGKEPRILGTAGVKAPTAPKSLLVVKGTGAAIDPAKTLVVEAVEAGLSGKNSQSTWTQAPQAASAKDVLGIADALTGQKVGSRVIVLLPATPAAAATATTPAQAARPAEVLIADVVGQF